MVMSTTNMWVWSANILSTSLTGGCRHNMKYKKYVLRFEGDPETVAFLKKHVAERQPNLGRARSLGRAAELLLGVEYKVTSVTLPRPTAEKVRSL